MSSDHAERLARGEDLEFRTARTGMIFLLMICVGFTIIGLCLLGGGDGLLRMLGIAVAVFFGLVGIPFTVWKLVRPALELTISAERGVYVAREATSPWIPWAHITRVDREVLAARPTVVLRLTPEAQERWDAAQRDAQGVVEEAPGGPGVVIPQTIAAPPEEVFRALAAGHDAWSGRSA